MPHISQKTPKRDCLKKISNDLYTEYVKIKKIADFTSQRLLDAQLDTFSYSFFITNSDANKMNNRKNTIYSIMDHVDSNIFVFSKSNNNKLENVRYEEREKTNMQLLVCDHIDTLSEEECNSILNKFINFIATDKSIKTYNEDLKTHSVNGDWIFDFIAKLVQFVLEVIGEKTTSEKIIETSKLNAFSVVVKEENLNIVDHEIDLPNQNPTLWTFK